MSCAIDVYVKSSNSEAETPISLQVQGLMVVQWQEMSIFS